MNICTRFEAKRLYELVLDEEDLRLLADLNLSSAVTSPYARDGTRFHLFPHPTIFEDAFKPMADFDGYYAFIGDASVKTIDDLARLIRTKAVLPIELPGDPEPLRIGYVHFYVPILASSRNP